MYLFYSVNDKEGCSQVRLLECYFYFTWVGVEHERSVGENTRRSRVFSPTS